MQNTVSPVCSQTSIPLKIGKSRCVHPGLDERRVFNDYSWVWSMTMAKLTASGLQCWMDARSIPVRGPRHRRKPPAGCHLLPQGEKPKARNERAWSPQPVISHCREDTATHTPSSAPRGPRCLLAAAHARASSPAPQSPPAPILPAALSTHAVFM